MSALTVTRTYDSGHVDGDELEWPRHTARQAARARAAGIRAAGGEVAWLSETAFEVRWDRGNPDLSHTERLEWRDEL